MTSPRPEILDYQPQPTYLAVGHYPASGGWLTVIHRDFDPADVPRCFLCPKSDCCVSPGGSCVVVADGYVDEESAALFARSDSRAAEARRLG